MLAAAWELYAKTGDLDDFVDTLQRVVQIGADEEQDTQTKPAGRPKSNDEDVLREMRMDHESDTAPSPAAPPHASLTRSTSCMPIALRLAPRTSPDQQLAPCRPAAHALGGTLRHRRTRIAIECPVDASVVGCLFGIGRTEGVRAYRRSGAHTPD